jgi:hypothetical protein
MKNVIGGIRVLANGVLDRACGGVFLTLLASLAMCSISCNSARASTPLVATTTPSTTQPATAPSTQTFRDAAGLVQLQYPGDWPTKTDPDYALSLTSGSKLFTLDIPDLPVHIPGMIPLNLVVNGYTDDLKQKYPGIKISDDTSPQISHARCHRVLSTWTEKNVETSEVATLIVHGDHVFILRIVAPKNELAAARTPYNAIVDSLKWLK